MGVHNPWTKHYQAVWENRFANHTLPMWLRIVCLAYGRHEANGHARFQRGELSWMLGRPPKEGESWKSAHPTTVRDAIATAVRHEWLAEDSCAECLMVPAHGIEGPPGNAQKPCPVHERKKAAKRKKEKEQHEKDREERRLKAV